MESVDQFDGKWYKSVDGSTDEWVFADETISGNISLVRLINQHYLSVYHSQGNAAEGKYNQN